MKNFLVKYFWSNGTLNRKEYFWFTILLAFLVIILAILLGHSERWDANIRASYNIIFCWFLFITSRRMRGMGFSVWWLLFPGSWIGVPIIGLISKTYIAKDNKNLGKI